MVLLHALPVGPVRDDPEERHICLEGAPPLRRETRRAAFRVLEQVSERREDIVPAQISNPLPGTPHLARHVEAECLPRRLLLPHHGPELVLRDGRAAIKAIVAELGKVLRAHVVVEQLGVMPERRIRVFEPIEVAEEGDGREREGGEALRRFGHRPPPRALEENAEERGARNQGLGQTRAAVMRLNVWAQDEKQYPCRQGDH